MPLLGAPFPVAVGLTELPEQWGFKTQYDLPCGVAVGLLNHDYVYMSTRHETSGGVKGADIKLPGGRHTAFLKQVALAKQKLRRQEASAKETAEIVYTAMAAEVRMIAQMVQDYAAEQVVATLGPLQINGLSTGDPRNAAGNASAHSSPALTRHFTDKCLAQALPEDGFGQWLMRERPASVVGNESRQFYSTLSQTQLYVDLLSREISFIVMQHTSSENTVFAC